MEDAVRKEVGSMPLKGTVLACEPVPTIDQLKIWRWGSNDHRSSPISHFGHKSVKIPPSGLPSTQSLSKTRVDALLFASELLQPVGDQQQNIPLF
jgi:hypothetical protein